MEALVLRKEIKPLSTIRKKTLVYKYEGVLNSSYKQLTQRNFFESDPNSIFGIKQRIKSWQYGHYSDVETILKLSVFAIVLTVALI